VDFAQPGRFNLTFINRDGQEETPLCIHRAPLSTHERMIGFLLEHYGGNFPVWLSPDQVRVIPITDSHNGYALSLVSQMKEQGIRAEADLSSERMNSKIRQAQLFKVPYMLVVGEREMSEGTVSLRRRDGSRQDGMPVDEFILTVRDRIDRRSQDL
jgi:threonyl-tRNA synthetase